MHFESVLCFCNGVLFSVTDKVYHWFIIIYSGMYDEQGRIIGRITTYMYSFGSSTLIYATFKIDIPHESLASNISIQLPIVSA